jgi:hypothetical protein
MDHCDFGAHKSPDMESIQKRVSLKNQVKDPLVQPVVGDSEGHLKTTTTTEESVDFVELRVLEGPNSSVMRLKDTMGETKLLSESATKKSSGRPPELAHHQRPCRITRMVSVSPDRTRERELDCDLFRKAATSRNQQASDDAPFLLHLYLPTCSGQPANNFFHGLTFIQANDSCRRKVTQTDPHIRGDGNAPLVLGHTDKKSGPSLLRPVRHWTSEDDKKHSLLHKDLEDDHLLHNSFWSTTGHETKLGLDGLPVDTEFEEFIAFQISGMKHN